MRLVLLPFLGAFALDQQIAQRTSAIIEKAQVDFAAHFPSFVHVRDNGVHVIFTGASSPYYNNVLSLNPFLNKETVSKWTSYWNTQQQAATWILTPEQEEERKMLADYGWLHHHYSVGLYYDIQNIDIHPYAPPVHKANIKQCESDADFAMYAQILQSTQRFEQDDEALVSKIHQAIFRLPIQERYQLGAFLALDDLDRVTSIAKVTYDGDYALIHELHGLGYGYEESMVKELLQMLRRRGVRHVVMLGDAVKVAGYLHYGFQITGTWNHMQLN